MVDQESWNILIVEDDQRLAELTREYLESNGMQVSIEANGALAAERIIAEVGTSGRIVHQPLPQDDPRRRRPDISRARAMLDWEPRVPLAEGLRQTCAYFAQQLNAAQPATAFPRIAPAVAAE